uniref:Selenium-binding protein n=1 Tax=Steinernema glaseri TaxID=37863 RepID=A0A1I7ZY66_9BILA
MRGGPSFMQLSLDGRRLYFTNSTYRTWDRQYYPELFKKGSEIYLIRMDYETNDKMELDAKFKVDLGTLSDGPFLGREIRLPNGDCTSDFFS